MSNARIIARNLTANWVGYGANLAVMFFLSPFILHSLGLAQYGIWQLLTVLTGYMGILDIGIRASTGRYIMLYMGSKEYDKVDETIRTGLGIYTYAGCLILIVGLILGFVFPNIFPSVSKDYHKIISVLLPILAVNIWISAVRTVLSSILFAYERFDLARSTDLIMLAIRTIGTIVVLKLGLDLIGLTAVVVGCNIVGLLLNIILSHRIHKGLRLLPLIVKRDRLNEMINYGIGAFIIHVSVKVIGQTDLVIVGNLINIESVAVYSVGATLLYYSNTALTLINQTFFPPLQRATAEGKMGEAQWLLFRQVRLAMVIGIAIYIGFTTFGESFIRLWMFHPQKFPEESVRQAAQVCMVLSGSKLLLLYGFGFRSLLSATGHIGFTAKIIMVEAITNLFLSIICVLIFKWGLMGVAAGTLFARLMTSTFIIPPYACRKAGINYLRYVSVIVSNAITLGVLFAGICFGIQRILPCNNWFEFFAQVSLTLVLYAPIALLLMIPADIKKRLRNKFDSFLLTKIK